MSPTRRDFLKLTTLGGTAATLFGFDLKPAYAQTSSLKIARASETRSTCPYCSVSCGVIIYTIGDRAKNVTPQVVHVEGDPDHPINRGTLCPKGASLEQDILNERRLLKSPRKSRRHAMTRLSRRMLRVTRSTGSNPSPGPAAVPTPTSLTTSWSKPCGRWE